MNEPDRPRVRVRSVPPGDAVWPGQVLIEGLGGAQVREIRINPIKAGEPITAWIEVFDVDVDLDLDPKIRLVGIADMEAARPRQTKAATAGDILSEPEQLAERLRSVLPWLKGNSMAAITLRHAVAEAESAGVLPVVTP